MAEEDLDVDVTAAALEAAKQEEEADVVDDDKKNEHRRKRYRERAEEEAKNAAKKAHTTPDAVLDARRARDRERYKTMTAEERQVYNSKRREQYHRQGEADP